MIKQIAPIVANSAAFEKFVELLEHTGGERDSLFRVLTYHRVDQPSAHPFLDPGLISASPEVFEAQMKYLASNYEIVSALDVIKAFEHPDLRLLPPRAVMITFDDAYSDFEAVAWPILKLYDLPVVLFVPTAFPDHPERLFWWDRLFNAIQNTSVEAINTSGGRLPISTPAQRSQAYKHLKNRIKVLPHDVAMEEVDRICSQLDSSPQVNTVLGWDSLRQLASEGVSLGAHTQNHPMMNRLALDDLQNEVLGSLQDLTRETGRTPLTFAYPSGMYNQEAVKVVEDAGFKLAFTTERGLNDLNRSEYLQLKRINIGSRTTMPVLRAQLLSWSVPLYSLSNKLFS